MRARRSGKRAVRGGSGKRCRQGSNRQVQTKGCRRSRTVFSRCVPRASSVQAGCWVAGRAEQEGETRTGWPASVGAVSAGGVTGGTSIQTGACRQADQQRGAQDALPAALAAACVRQPASGPAHFARGLREAPRHAMAATQPNGGAHRALDLAWLGGHGLPGGSAWQRGRIIGGECVIAD